MCEPRNTDLRAVGDLQRRAGALVGRGLCDFCLSVHVGLAADGRLKTFCHYVRPVFRAFRVIPLPHIQGFVQTRCPIFFLALQSRIDLGSGDCLSGGPYGNNRPSRKSALRADYIQGLRYGELDLFCSEITMDV